VTRINRFLIPAVIFIFAFAVRLAYIEQMRGNASFGNLLLDAQFYDSWAQKIAEGDWLGTEVFFMGPLYPYFLAVLYGTLGRDLYLVRVIQTIIGSLSCVLIYLIGKKIFNPVVGVLAGLAAALYGMFVFYDATILMETLVVFLDLLAVVLLLYAVERKNKRIWFLAGFVLGLSALGRGTILLFVPLVFFWFILNEKKERKTILRNFAVFCTGVLLVLAVCTLRNFVVTGDFVVISSNWGVNFYQGTNEFATGKISSPLPNVDSPQVMVAELGKHAENVTGKNLTESEVARFWFLKGVEYVRKNPLDYAKLELRKFLLFWNWYEIPSNTNYYFFSRFSGLLQSGFLLMFGIIAPLGLLGILLSAEQLRKTSILIFMIVSAVLSVLIFFVDSRYRLPAVAFLMIFAAYALHWFFDSLKSKKYKKILISLVVLILFFGFVNYDVEKLGMSPRLDLKTAHENMADIFMNNGLYGEAINEYNLALNLAPESVTAHCSLGDVYFRLGATQRGIYEYNIAKSLNPGYVRNFCRYGKNYEVMR